MVHSSHSAVHHHPGRITVTYSWVNAHLQTRSMDIVSITLFIPMFEVLEKKSLREITKFHTKPRHKFDQLHGLRLRLCLKQIPCAYVRTSRGDSTPRCSYAARRRTKARTWHRRTAQEMLDNQDARRTAALVIQLERRARARAGTITCTFRSCSTADKERKRKSGLRGHGGQGYICVTGCGNHWRLYLLPCSRNHWRC